jgi:hypothetical protein
VNLVLFPQSNLHTLLPLRPCSVTIYYAGATGTTTAHAGARIRPAKTLLGLVFDVAWSIHRRACCNMTATAP